MAGTFEIYQDRKGGYRFRLKARNGEVVATGEAYPTEKAALKGVDAVQRAAADAKIVTPAAAAAAKKAPAKKAGAKTAAPKKAATKEPAAKKAAAPAAAPAAG